MRRVAVIVIAAAAAACGPEQSANPGCAEAFVAGDLVVTEVFADFAAPGGSGGTDDGKEWFEIFNNTERAVSLAGLTITHGRVDAEDPKRHILSEITLSPGQYFTLGNAAPDLAPPYVDYGYGADLGGMYNSDGGKLTLSCGTTEIDAAQYDMIESGHSRQLTGAQPPDYTINDDLANWCGAVASEYEPANFGTPGAENDCTPIVVGKCDEGGVSRDAIAPMPGDLVITEIMPNPAAVSDGDGEWFEAKALRDVDLNGVGIDRAGDTTAPRVIESAECIRIPAGSYAVFAKNLDVQVNGGLPVNALRGPLTFSFSLVDGTVDKPGDVRVVVGDTVIDAVTWTSTRSGKSHQLDPDLVDATANDSEANFCDGGTAYGAGDLGTPGADNEQCTALPPTGMCDDGGTIRAIVKPAVGALVITELLPNPAGMGTDATHEWFEITNASQTGFDLNELSLDRAGDSAAPTPIQSGACLRVAPGGFAVFAHGTDPMQNGMLPAVAATFPFALVQSSGDVRVLDGETVLDAITWGTVPASFDGKSIQLAPSKTTTTANDASATAIDAGVWCLGTASYGDGSNLGTPNAANAPCT